jgi:cell division protein FtsB
MLSPGRILLAGTLVVAVYLLISAGTSLLHSYRLANDEARLRDEVQHLDRQQQELEQIRDYLRTDEYVEFMARRVFGLVKPGETLVIVDAPAPAPPARDAGIDTEWWERLFGR